MPGTPPPPVPPASPPPRAPNPPASPPLASNPPPRPSLARQIVPSLALAAVATAGLAAQFSVTHSLPATTGVMHSLWLMGGYFTVLTNALVAAHMLAIAFGWRISSRRAAGLVVAIGMVGVVYHLVLAGLWAPTGLAWWADQTMHSATPAFTLLWWLACAPKQISRADLPFWLVWPLAYCGYALLRGSLTGFWAYPFLDFTVLGPVATALNLGLICLGFTGFGLALIALARLPALRQA